jgi:hypothetical protein
MLLFKKNLSLNVKSLFEQKMNLKNCHITKKGMKNLSYECVRADKYIILNLQNIANII